MIRVPQVCGILIKLLAILTLAFGHSEVNSGNSEVNSGNSEVKFGHSEVKF